MRQETLMRPDAGVKPPCKVGMNDTHYPCNLFYCATVEVKAFSFTFPIKQLRQRVTDKQIKEKEANVEA